MDGEAYYREFIHKTGRRFIVWYKCVQDFDGELHMIYTGNTKPVLYIAKRIPRSDIVASSYSRLEAMCEKLIDGVVKAIRKKEVKYIKLPREKG